MKLKALLFLLTIRCFATFTFAQATTQPIAITTFAINASAEVVTFTTSPAPATVHLQALNLLNAPADWLNEQYQWDFGEPGKQFVINPRTNQPVDLNSSIKGPIAAYFYENPGTYTVLLSRSLSSGRIRNYQARVIVPESHRTIYYISPDGSDGNSGLDINHSLRTAGAAASRVKDHTEFRFRRGASYLLNRECGLKNHDVVIDCYGDPTLPIPVLFRTGPGATTLPTTQSIATTMPSNSLIFSFWPGESGDVTIRRVGIDSQFNNALAVGNYTYHYPTANFGILRGNNITVADCEFHNLIEGPHGDARLSGALFLRNKQMDPRSIPSRTLWLEGTDIAALGNVATNSVNESPLRAAATGIIRGVIAFNDIAQELDFDHNRSATKAAVTLRTLTDVNVFGNKVSNAEFSFDPRLDNAVDERIAIDSNVVVNSFLHIKTNVRHAVCRNNSVERDGGPCITISAGQNAAVEWIEDLAVIDNQGRGWLGNGRMLQVDDHGENTLRSFVFDAGRNVYQRIAEPLNR